MLRWTAALLSLPLPGLGHALVGALPRALVIATLSLFCQALFALVMAAETITPTLLCLAALWMVLVLSASLATAADAWRLARTPRDPPVRWSRRTAALTAVLALNVALAFLPITPLVWRSFYIPSGSMIPTLRIGDRFIVQTGWYDAHPVQRGDIIVFTDDPAAARPTDFVKRVIGLGGDRIRVTKGILLINGIPVPATRDPDNPNQHFFTLPDGPRYTVLKFTDQGFVNNTPEFLVPPGHVFVIGDNMDNSGDSRFEPRIRYIPTANLIGRAAIVYWPFTDGRFGTRLR